MSAFHAPSLLATIVVSLLFAYLFGLAARALRLPPLVGYLLAGVALGPFTPGFVADQKLTAELAEIGVALLLFGVGLHFSIADLRAVWRLAVPGALLQITASTAIGFAVGRLVMGWSAEPALILGLALAIASTAVATRSLDERGQLSAEPGRIALGWLVMQDLVVILALVLLPAASGLGNGAGALVPLLGRTFLELAGFVAVVLLVGRRTIPWLLAQTARTGSRELFALAVIASALGIAYGSAQLFGVSLGLGAFFAGVVLAESDLIHQAAAETLPVQRLFTVIFFVSVGMLFDPFVVLRAPGEVAALLATILIGTGGVTLLLLLALRAEPRSAVLVAAGLSQIAEFSFILTGEAAARGVLPPDGRSLVLAAALLSIALNPFVFRATRPLGGPLARWPALRRWRERGARRRRPGPEVPTGLRDHAIIVGHGRVGSIVAAALARHALPFVVIEDDWQSAEALRRQKQPVVYGDATRLEVLQAARPEAARLLVVAVPDRFVARQIIELARSLNPRIGTVVRTHTDEDVAWLTGQAIGLVVMSERETALGMAEYALREFEQEAEAAKATIDALREVPAAAP